jgi:hypothetical protein
LDALLRACLIVLILALGVLGAAILVLPRLPPTLLYRSDIRRAQSVIAEIESYHEHHHIYPDPSELEVPPHFFYELPQPDRYILGFAVGFDEQYFWDSSTKRWSFDK